MVSMNLSQTPVPSLTDRGRTIRRASYEWVNRPDDQRYLSLQDLLVATKSRWHASDSRTIVNKELVVQGSSKGEGLTLVHPALGPLTPTNWSIGQLASISHTPAKWIREAALVPMGLALACQAINFGLQHLAAREEVQIMSLVNQHARGDASLRCIVGPDYGRIYDHQVVQAVLDVNEDGRWHIPAASYQAHAPLRATTLYASDRDVFIFLVDERNPITVRTPSGIRSLFRGFMVWNSEVGHKRFGFMTFLYDFVCDNRTVWGAREVKEFSIKHTKNAPEAFAKEIRPMLRSYAEASPRGVEESLQAATRRVIASTDSSVVEWLRTRNFTKKEADGIVLFAKQEEGGANSLWQIVNGGTAFARSIPHCDERVSLERRVSGLLRAV